MSAGHSADLDLVDIPGEMVSGNIQQAKDEVSLATCIQHCPSLLRQENSARFMILPLFFERNMILLYFIPRQAVHR